MYRRIVVGFDGSDHGRDALVLATALARPAGASLTLVWTIDRAPAFFPLERLEDEFREEANAALCAATAELPAELHPRQAVVNAGSPARALTEFAENQGADLIVLGSSHRGVMGRVFAGSVGQQVLDAAPCTVAIAPAGLRERKAFEPRVIGVGLDGEPQSLAALVAAEGVAMAFDAGLRLISVIAPSDLYVPQGSSAEVHQAIESAARAHAEAIVDDGLAALSPDVRAVGAVLDGSVAPTLEAAAEAAGIDLIVVGSRGFGPVRRVLLGSVSSHVVTAAPCAVIVVPRAPARPRRDEPRAETPESAVG